MINHTSITFHTFHMGSSKCKKTFYGSTTVGEKGQVVIPVEARRTLELDSGEKLLVLGVDNESLILMKPSKLAEHAEELSKKLASMQDMINQNS